MPANELQSNQVTEHTASKSKDLVYIDELPKPPPFSSD